MPTSPKWTLAALVDHVGATQRVVATLVGERMTEPSTLMRRGAGETRPVRAFVRAAADASTS